MVSVPLTDTINVLLTDTTNAFCSSVNKYVEIKKINHIKFVYSTGPVILIYALHWDMSYDLVFLLGCHNFLFVITHHCMSSR
jgi:hypothetical protein